jgi:proteasome-associated ATPase
MDRYEIRREIQRAFLNSNKSHLHEILNKEDIINLVDILWEYMEEADSGHVAKRNLIEKQNELEELLKKIKALNDKSGQRTRCLEVLPDRRALVQLGPLKEEVMISPSVNINQLKIGTEVLVIGSNEGRLIAAIRKSSLREGHLTKIHNILDDDRVIVEDGGREFILRLAEGIKCNKGDKVRYDLDSQMVLEVLESAESSTFSLSEIPEATFDDVKGLEAEKEFLRERIIYPVVYKEKFNKYGIKPIRAALFHGPAGCGKTYLAGAIFNEMIKLKREGPITQNPRNYKGFFVINGPEVLSKWAGTTEDTIRKIFEEARKAATESKCPSLIFWDEIESITRKRTDSATYTPEKTVVPTLLSEIQGLESTHNVILIGATNRPDLIDPALMRPGRLGDAIIEIPRPDRQAAKDILEKSFIRDELPTSLKDLLSQGLVEQLVAHVYDNKNPLAFARLQDGSSNPLMRQELVNGALFSQLGEEIVRKTCMIEINNSESPKILELLKMSDNILLSQIGILDAGVKNGFNFDISNYVMDISLNT